MGKRSSIDKDRLDLLKSKDTVYLITCHQYEFYCTSHGDGRCRRGFFSLFLQSLYGIQFAKRLNIEYRVDFGNLNYSYSDPRKFNGNENFWEYYFVQDSISKKSKIVYNTRFETYPLRIWDRSFIRQLNQIYISNLRLQPEMMDNVNRLLEIFKKFKVLGVHHRKTDHYLEVKPAQDDSFTGLIDKMIHSYDRIFLATDDEDTVHFYSQKYGDKLIFHNFNRSTGQTSIHGGENISNGYELGKEALLDCYSLSLCKHLILSQSNLSYCALILNPEIPYHLLESIPAKWYKFKTLGAYYLDKWGIRKW